MSQKMKNHAISPITPITIAQILRLRKPQTAIRASMIAINTKSIIPKPLWAWLFILFPLYLYSLF
jgi:hypothetical protein